MLLTKRLLDTRKEFIENNIKKSLSYTMSNDILKSITNEQNRVPIYKVLNEIPEMYCVCWEDIQSFLDNPNSIELEIQLKNFPELKIKTMARNKQEFLGQIVNSFENKTIHKIYKISRFVKRIEYTNKLVVLNIIILGIFEK